MKVVISLLVISFGIISVPAHAEQVVYTYDSLNRITGINYGNGKAIVNYAYDTAGNRLSMTTTQAEQLPPALVISNTSNIAVTTSSITISGTASDSGQGGSGIVSVTVNGIPALGGSATGSNTANWSVSVPLSAGVNTIVVTATDGSPYANTTTQTITVTYNVTPPAPACPGDTDCDGMSDKWELAHGLNPSVNDANGDLDGDGYTNIEEYRAGTDPANPLSKPPGVNGLAYVLFQDNFNAGLYDDRWYLQPVASDAIYSVTESTTDLQMTLQRPTDQCRDVELTSFAPLDKDNLVYRAKLRLDGGGTTVLGLMKGYDPNNRIEIRFVETVPYLRIRSWDGGQLNDVPIVKPTDYQGVDLNVRLIKTSNMYYVFVNHVFQGAMVNNGLGDTGLRPTLLEESCATDSSNVNSHIQLVEMLLDRDGDGLPDIDEDKNLNGIVDPGESDPLNPDTDGDGIKDGFDNCVLVRNPDQRDTNGDGYGNVCDPDLNNDGIVNSADLSIMKSKMYTNDPDADLNGDGIVNFGDLAILKSMYGKPPGPSGLVP